MEIKDQDWIFLNTGEIMYGKIEKFSSEGIEYTENGNPARLIAKIQMDKKRKQDEKDSGIITKFIEKPVVRAIALNDIAKIISHPQKKYEEYKNELEKLLDPLPLSPEANAENKNTMNQDTNGVAQ